MLTVWSLVATFFQNFWRIPQCVGAIDWSCIPIIVPEEYPQEYYSHKEWQSVVLQAVVDGKGLFLDVCVGYLWSGCNTRVLWHICGKSYVTRDCKANIWQSCWTGLSDQWSVLPHAEFAHEALFRHWLMYFGRLKGGWRCLLIRHNWKLELTKTNGTDLLCAS